uniref:Secreted protein n=1 Tax=Cyanoderma ruficeps TaxID=181631 RepID=A0A8C3R296_9PASS
MRTSSALSVFWGLINLLMASTKMLNISAVAKTELPNAPSTSARQKPKVLALCHLMRLKRTPNSPMIMEIRWERTAKASEAKERELPTLTTHMRMRRLLRPEYRPMPAAPCPALPGSTETALSEEQLPARDPALQLSAFLFKTPICVHICTQLVLR